MRDRVFEAMLVVDCQRDFFPGGALGVKGAEKIITPLNRAIRWFDETRRPVYFSRCWHPAEMDPHFTTWPSHCVQDTLGAEFHPALYVPEDATIITKGTMADQDAYSAFDGRTDTGVYLSDDLDTVPIIDLYIGGLATDYCVLATVLKARELGHVVIVNTDWTEAVDYTNKDKYLAQMAEVGAVIL